MLEAASAVCQKVSGVVLEAELIDAAAMGLDIPQRVCKLTLVVEMTDVPSADRHAGIRPGSQIHVHTRQTDLTLLKGGRLTSTVRSGDTMDRHRLWLVEILSAARPR